MTTFKTNDFVVIGNNEGIGKVVEVIERPARQSSLSIASVQIEARPSLYTVAAFRTKDGTPTLQKGISKKKITGPATEEQINWWTDRNSNWDSF